MKNITARSLGSPNNDAIDEDGADQRVHEQHDHGDTSHLESNRTLLERSDARLPSLRHVRRKFIAAQANSMSTKLRSRVLLVTSRVQISKQATSSFPDASSARNIAYWLVALGDVMVGRILLCAFVLVVAGGCTTIAGWRYSLTPRTGIETSSTFDGQRTLIFSGENNCPIIGYKALEKPASQTSLIATALSSLAPVAVNFFTGAIADYLQRSKEELNATYTASGTGQLFDAKGTLIATCVVIARGTFGPVWDAEAAAKQAMGKSLLNGQNTALARAGLARYPDFYFEAWLDPVYLTDKDGKPTEDVKFAFVLRPALLHFGRTAAENVGTGKKSIGMLFAFGDAEKSTKQNDTPAPTRPAPTTPAQPGATAPAGGGGGGVGGGGGGRTGGAAGERTPRPPAGGEQPPDTNKPQPTVSAVALTFPNRQEGFEYAGVNPADADKVKSVQGNVRNVTNPLWDQTRIVRIDPKNGGLINVSAVITESEDLSDFEKFVEKFLSGNKDSIDKALTSLVQGAVAQPAAGGGKR